MPPPKPEPPTAPSGSGRLNELNTLANTWSIDLLTRKINGGMAGAAERSRLCEAALQAIGA